MVCNVTSCDKDFSRCFLDTHTPVMMGLKERQKLWRLCTYHSETMDRIQAHTENDGEIREVSWEESVVWEIMNS